MFYINLLKLYLKMSKDERKEFKKDWKKFKVLVKNMF